jgi:hypothetical protein
MRHASIPLASDDVLSSSCAVVMSPPAPAFGLEVGLHNNPEKLLVPLREAPVPLAGMVVVLACATELLLMQSIEMK